MDIASIGIYFATNGSAMIAGLIVWWAIENMQPVDQPRRKPAHVIPVMIMGVLLTPVGAWVISAIVRSRRLTRDIKAGGD